MYRVEPAHVMEDDGFPNIDHYGFQEEIPSATEATALFIHGLIAVKDRLGMDSLEFIGTKKRSIDGEAGIIRVATRNTVPAPLGTRVGRKRVERGLFPTATIGSTSQVAAMAGTFRPSFGLRGELRPGMSVPEIHIGTTSDATTQSARLVLREVLEVGVEIDQISRLVESINSGTKAF